MLYQIPLFERFLGTSLFGRAKCLSVDNVGLFVYYEGDKSKLRKRYIRSCLIGRKSTACIVEAPNIVEAIKTFYNEWWGASIGGETEESKALWINRQESILELPFCELLHRNKREEFICGEENKESEGNGEFGMCVLQGYDAPDECPLSKFDGIVFAREESKNLPVKTLVVNEKEFKVISANDIMPLRKRIWLNVDGMQLHFYDRREDNVKEKIAWMSVKTKAFDVTSVYFQKDEFGLSQNWQGSPRFLDAPISHMHKRQAKQLLSYILAKALHDVYLEGKKVQLTEFLEGTGPVPETPFFKPESWGKKSLRIPVDFIKLTSFECHCKGGPVITHVRLGNHLIFWSVQIYDGKDSFTCGESNIHDKRILNAVNTLLCGEEIREYLRGVSQSGRSPMDHREFIDKAPNCDTEEIPTVRFY
jgi:hypothetical protein